MPALLVNQQQIQVGKEVVIEGPSPTGQFAAVFEDDGETGYFYAMDNGHKGNPIVDALHIYDVEAITDKDEPSQVQIVWSPDHLKAALLINDFAHAVFDFEAKRGYCQDGFPEESVSNAGWSPEGHDWDDAALEPFQG